MANYYAHARSNYFLVKDVDAFKEEMDGITSIEVIESKNGHYGLLSKAEDGWPWSGWDLSKDEDVDIEWEDIFARHLADDEVAIIMEVGNEKLRYLSGVAIAYNNKKETRAVDLASIYELAKELGANVTEAYY